MHSAAKKNESNGISASKHCDPLVCGLGNHTGGGACRATADREAKAALSPTDRALRHWDELRGRYWDLLRHSAAGPGERPPALTAEQLGALAWALVDPRSRELLREVLLDLLGPDIVRAISAAVQVASGQNGRSA